MIIRRVDPFSVGKIAGLLYTIIGLFIGAILSIVAMAGATFAAEAGEGSPLIGVFLGVGAIIALPIFYGVLGFVLFSIAAALYNVLASVVGGIRIDVEQSVDATGPASR